MTSSQAHSKLEFRFAVNATGRDKDWDYRKLAKNFRDRTGNIDDVITHVKKGHALCAGNLGGKRRSKSNVIGSQWVLLDIDNSGKDTSGEKCYKHQLSLEEAIEHPFIKNYCALIYTTASHRADWHKFRLVFLLPQFVEGSETVEVLTRFLMKHLPHDPACKDASRVFYGSSKATFPLIQPGVTLPAEWVEAAIATAREEKWERQKRIAEIEQRKKELRNRAEAEGWDTDTLIRQALSFIPPRSPGSGNYLECVQVLMALNDYYGAVKGQAIAEEWSPSISGNSWNIGAKFRSFRGRGGISIGTLFHIAAQYGFKFPKTESPFFETQAINQDGVLERTVTRQQWQSAKTFRELKEEVDKLQRNPGKSKQSWGFGEKKEGEQEQPETDQSFVYETGERHSIWINSTLKYIADCSGTGSGKSYDAGRLQPADFGCEKIFYISSDSRNPTTPTLKKGWVHLEGRHNGLVVDDKDKLRRKKHGQRYEIKPNCARVDTINALKDANIQAAYSANIACLNCSYLEVCRGKCVFGYLGERASTLSSTRIITHPQSLPVSGVEDGSFDYSNSLLVLEEWSQILKNFETVTVTAKDVDMLIATLVVESNKEENNESSNEESNEEENNEPSVVESNKEKNNESSNKKNLKLLKQLLPLLTKIKSILSKGEKAPSRFGWSYHHLQELLEVPQDIDLATLAEVTFPDLSVLNPTEEYGEDIADLPAEVRRHFQKRDSQTADKVKQIVLKQWILQLIEILQGNSDGYISADSYKLVITTPDTRLVEILRAAKKVICLDATGRVEELASILGISSEQVFRCKQNDTETANNLEVIQVANLGRMGISRGDDQHKRGKAVISEITKQCAKKGEGVEVVTYKKFDGKYQWFVDSRGSNDLEGVENIILDGIPTPNLEALRAEFSCIYKNPPKPGTKIKKENIALNNQLPEAVEAYFEYEVSVDDEFADFIRHRILETIKQAIGRNRATRYPKKNFKVYVLGDYPLDIPVTLVQAAEITTDAATKVERAKIAIAKAVEELKKQGRKITQSAVGKLANLSQQRVSQLREFLLVLLKGIHTKSSKNNKSNLSANPPPEDVEWVAQTYLPLVIFESPKNLLGHLAELLEVYSPLDLLTIWQLSNSQIQISLLSALFAFTPELLDSS
ncbi:MAG: PriCT-2 domain-containing protein [Cyanobacteria bacterium P01_D01_bin.116]